MILATAECTITIIAASVPVLRLLVRDVQPIPNRFFNTHENLWMASHPLHSTMAVLPESRRSPATNVGKEVREGSMNPRLSKLSDITLEEKLHDLRYSQSISDVSSLPPTAPPYELLAEEQMHIFEAHISDIRNIGKNRASV